MRVAAVDKFDNSKYVIDEKKAVSRVRRTPSVVSVMSQVEFVERETASVAKKSKGIDIKEIRIVAAKVTKDTASDDLAHEVIGVVGNTQ